MVSAYCKFCGYSLHDFTGADPLEVYKDMMADHDCAETRKGFAALNDALAKVVAKAEAQERAKKVKRMAGRPEPRRKKGEPN